MPMLTSFIATVITLFLVLKPPLQFLKPHFAEPPRRNPTRITKLATAPASLSAASTPTLVTTAPISPTATQPLTSSVSSTLAAASAPALVANPTLALAQQDPAARAVLYHRVAARSLGEGSFAVPEIACTVKNRLQVSGASLNAVLRAYHARDVQPQPATIEVVRQVFEGELPCPATWWYALSLQDTRHWQPHPQPALIIRRNNRSQIWIFHR